MGGVGPLCSYVAAAPGAHSRVAVVGLVAAVLLKWAVPNLPSFSSEMCMVTLLLAAWPCLLPQLTASAVQTQLLVRLGCNLIRDTI